MTSLMTSHAPAMTQQSRIASLILTLYSPIMLSNLFMHRRFIYTRTVYFLQTSGDFRFINRLVYHLLFSLVVTLMNVFLMRKVLVFVDNLDNQRGQEADGELILFRLNE